VTVDRLRTWLSVVYPAAAVEADEADGLDRPPTPCANVGGNAPSVLRTLFSTGPSAASVDEAKRMLRASRVDIKSIGNVVVALYVLAAADDVASASRWARSLQANVDVCPSRLWRAVYSSVRAEIALLRGAVGEAGRRVESALSMVPAEYWGVAVGHPLGVLLRAYTLSGELDRAAELLRVPVPLAVYQSPLGMGYLLARGRYHLAVNEPAVGLDDFLTVGRLVRAWGCDVPELFPWRGDLACCYVRLGRAEQARALAAEQVERCSAPAHRVRAESLYALALSGPPHQRRELLEQAMALLQGGHAPIESASVLAALADAVEAAGQESKARMLRWRVEQILENVGAVSPSALAVDSDDLSLADYDRSGTVASELLTNAEIRVAALAAQGLSNRQISSRLFITVSTVEQHLTRVYRKLNVKSRAALPTDLVVEQLGGAEAS
jgi:ATP/maltotriose-dependent transcriptional regulator MalT